MKEYNFYELFGIPRNATEEQIDKAYKRLMLIYHSDKTGKGDEMVKLINHAKDILKDPQKRNLHDSANDFLINLFNISNENSNSSKILIADLRNEIGRLKNEIYKKESEINLLHKATSNNYNIIQKEQKKEDENGCENGCLTALFISIGVPSFIFGLIFIDRAPVLGVICLLFGISLFIVALKNNW